MGIVVYYTFLIMGNAVFLSPTVVCMDPPGTAS